MEVRRQEIAGKDLESARELRAFSLDFLGRAQPSLSCHTSVVRVRVVSTYPEDVIFRGSRHGLLHGLVQLLLGCQISGDGPPDLGPKVMQCAQAGLEARAPSEGPALLQPPPASASPQGGRRGLFLHVPSRGRALGPLSWAPEW